MFALLSTACSPADTTAPGGVLLVVLDTTRADHVSCYGYPRETTPHLDRLAAEGERFENAFAQSPWTLPAVATLLTGQPPHVHGAGLSAEGVFGIRPELPTLAEKLSAAGYRTAAFVNVTWLQPRLSGLDRGFDHYDARESDESNRGQRDARATTDAALTWLSGLGNDPFFVVVHYFDAHLTYDPPAPYDSLFEPDDGPTLEPGFGSTRQAFELRSGQRHLTARERQSLIARYDGEIRFADEQLGRLRHGLESLGHWDDTLVVVVADHGEEFWDHGQFEHGHSHHREVLRVPLVVRRPDGPSGLVHAHLARQLDVAPTVLDAANLAFDALPGHVLGASAAGHSIAEGSLWVGDLRSLRSSLGTVVLPADGSAATYYAPEDTFEVHPRSAGPAQDDLVRALRAHGEPARSQPAVRFGERDLERLRSLGYLR